MTKGSHPQPEAPLPERAGPCPGPTAQRGPREQHEMSPHGRFPEFGPRSETQWAPPQSPTECVVLLHLKHQGLGNDFGNQSEGDRASSPLLLLKRNLLNTNLKDEKWLLCMCSNCLSKKSQWDFILFFIMYLKYIFTEQRLQSTGGRKGRQ